MSMLSLIQKVCIFQLKARLNGPEEYHCTRVSVGKTLHDALQFVPFISNKWNKLSQFFVGGVCKTSLILIRLSGETSVLPA